MIKNTMKKIKDKIQKESSITKERKVELLSLLSVLESEITKLSKTDSEHAESIHGFIERSAHEATRQKEIRNYLAFTCRSKRVSQGLRGITSRVGGEHEQDLTILENMEYEMQ